MKLFCMLFQCDHFVCVLFFASMQANLRSQFARGQIWVTTFPRILWPRPLRSRARVQKRQSCRNTKTKNSVNARNWHSAWLEQLAAAGCLIKKSTKWYKQYHGCRRCRRKSKSRTNRDVPTDLYAFEMSQCQPILIYTETICDRSELQHTTIVQQSDVFVTFLHWPQQIYCDDLLLWIWQATTLIIIIEYVPPPSNSHRQMKCKFVRNCIQCKQFVGILANHRHPQTMPHMRKMITSKRFDYANGKRIVFQFLIHSFAFDQNMLQIHATYAT